MRRSLLVIPKDDRCRMGLRGDAVATAAHALLTAYSAAGAGVVTDTIAIGTGTGIGIGIGEAVTRAADTLLTGSTRMIRP